MVNWRLHTSFCKSYLRKPPTVEEALAQLKPKEGPALAKEAGFVTSSIQLSETASGLIHNKEEIELPEVSDSDGEDDDVHKKMYQMLCTEEVLLGNETKKKRKKRSGQWRVV
ncbi:hypothetical protein Tco_1006357 [Tanacetum coccineum]|uniref:Uncharacterized protein n=1 Tax=Tanacetum coccineum TaxID=301880 RepID=A0ABQ5FIL4_9ASTR